jgi:hypothetical protein
MARKIQTAWSKQIRTWVFFYQTERSGDKIVIGTQDCKQPERTALRKLQRSYWNMQNVVATGYTSDLNEPMLVWPQSKLPLTN